MTSIDSGSGAQLPWDRLQPTDAAVDATVFAFELKRTVHNPAIGVAALLLQLGRYGNENPSVVIHRQPGQYSLSLLGVGGPNADAMISADFVAAVSRQLAVDPGRDSGVSNVVSLCVVNAGTEFEQACVDGLKALRTRHESLRLIVAQDDCRSAFVYDANSFNAPTIHRMAAHWRTLIDDIAHQPTSPVAELAMLPTEERADIAAGSIGPHLDDPHSDFFAQFTNAARLHATRTAVIYRDRRVSYAELDILATRIARKLRDAGLQVGDHVAVGLDPGPYGAACILGILRLRAVYVPIDPGYPAARIATMVTDCGARLIIASAAHESSLAALGIRVLAIEQLVAPVGDDAADFPNEPSLPGDAAYVFYTSGTTGQPKGVLASRANLAQYVGSAIRRYELVPDDVMPCLARATFSISLFELLAPLACGAASLVLDRDHVLDAPRLATTLQDVTIFHAGPSLLKNLLTHVESQPSPANRFSRLRHASSGGDLIAPEVLVRMRAVFAPAEIFVIYGCSEISVMGCTWKVPPTGQILRTFVGSPFEGIEIRVLDSQQRAVPVGVSGEVYFCGPGVIDKYLNRPELTATRFATLEGRRFYNTGDVGRLSPEGLLQLMGRLDFQVQLRGMRVELGEVEYALRQCAGVLDGVVSARTDDSGELQLVAYYVPQTPQVTAAALRAWLVTRLPDYMVPALYHPLEKLPLNANLKVDRKALPTPSFATARASTGKTPIWTPTEQRLAEIWHEVLGVKDAEPVDDFFLLGGSSLGVMRLITRIAVEFGVRVAASEVFSDATLRQLAHRIDGYDGTRVGRDTVPRLPDAERSDWRDLSAAQERMWFWSEMAPGTALYNVPIMVSIDGSVDVARLQSSLDALLRRHEVLRCRWRVLDGRPMQRVDADACCPLRVERASALSNSIGVELLRLAEAEALRPIDPTVELPIRGLLLDSASGSNLLLLTLHHSVCDGWSTEILLRDLFTYYHTPTSTELPALPVQYLDFAAWEAGWLAAGTRAEDLHYWTRKLAGVPGSVDLPLDRQRPTAQRFRGALHTVSFSTTEVASLRALAQRSGTTLFMVLLAGWQTLLYRLTRQSVIVTGSVIANRGLREVDNLVAYFANSVALRADFTEEITVADLLSQLRTTSLEAYDHQAVPFEEVVEALQLPRDPSRMPLIQTFIELQPPIEALPPVPGLLIERQMLGTPVAKFDLSLELQEVATGLRGCMEFDTDLFDSTTVARWSEYLHVLLQAMCGDDTQLVATLPVLPYAERQAQLVTWNTTARPYDNAVPVYRKFEKQAVSRPHAPAATFEESILSYGELNSRANQLARHIESLGVGRDVPVGVFMERSLELVVAIVGIHKAGAVYVPLDPDLPAERIATISSDCAFQVILTQSHLLNRLGAAVASAAGVVLLDSSAPVLAGQPTENGLHTSAPSDLAYIIYTSGSTGSPKGVEVPHLGLTNHINWMEEAMAFSQADRYLQKTTISFDAAVADFWLPLQTGACIVLARPGGHKDLAYQIDLIRRERVSATQFVPSALRVLVDEPGLSSCTSLRYLIVGGEALDWDTVRSLQQQLPSVEIGNFYGPSEGSDDSTHYPVPRGVNATGIVPIGLPIANVQCHVLDGSGQLAPIGAAGELHIAGAGLARGYRNRPDLTAERFVTNSELPGVRLYRTGDVVRRTANGVIEFLGRADHQIKLRGFRIELDEIEAAVRALANPRQCAVVARKKPSGEHMIVAYLVESMTAEVALRSALLARLPEYMVPTAYVALSELPVLANGKLNRHALPEPQMAIGARAVVAPSSDTELLVCGVFLEALGAQSVSVTDNFFDLGGHSLMAGRIMSRLRAATSLALPLRLLFEHPTIAGLATAIDASRWSERESDRTLNHTAAKDREEFEL